MKSSRGKRSGASEELLRGTVRFSVGCGGQVKRKSGQGSEMEYFFQENPCKRLASKAWRQRSFLSRDWIKQFLKKTFKHMLWITINAHVTTAEMKNPLLQPGTCKCLMGICRNGWFKWGGAWRTASGRSNVGHSRKLRAGADLLKEDPSCCFSLQRTSVRGMDNYKSCMVYI